MGFVNFYRRFIRDFSRVAAHLFLHPIVTFTEVELPFLKLKGLFTSAPTLVQSDPSLEFVVEVDASDTRVGVVLLQCSSLAQKLHPCAYVSWRLTPKKRNYIVGSRELLAVKLALEKWSHWLEGVEHPFLVWTDHKNLAYIQTAKRLDSWQARWALFFGKFNFTTWFKKTFNLMLSLSPVCL